MSCLSSVLSSRPLTFKFLMVLEAVSAVGLQFRCRTRFNSASWSGFRCWSSKALDQDKVQQRFVDFMFAKVLEALSFIARETRMRTRTKTWTRWT